MRTARKQHRSTVILRLGVLVLSGLVLTSCGSPVRGRTHGPTCEQPPPFREDPTSAAMPCSRPEFFHTGPAIKSRMLALVDSATDYILIDSLLVLHNPATHEVLESLARKKRSGVRVFVLADSSSRFVGGGEPGFSWLRRNGVPCAEYNPMLLHRLPLGPRLLHRDHRKFWIVDGKLLFMGGANIHAPSLLPTEDGGNLDVMALVRSVPTTKVMIESFVATWNRQSGLALNPGDFPVRGNGVTGSTLWLADQNGDVGREDIIPRMFEGLFAEAEREVWLVQPYTFVTRGILDDVRMLTARGVRVHVMLPGDVQAPRFRLASYYGIADLLRAGAEVRTLRRGLGALHAKITIVDGEWASVGSANLNNRSLRLAKEANLVFQDPRAMADLRSFLDQLMENSRAVGMAEARRYRTPRHWFSWVLMQWAG